jgi:hypothetical protein
MHIKTNSKIDNLLTKYNQQYVTISISALDSDFREYIVHIFVEFCHQCRPNSQLL